MPKCPRCEKSFTRRSHREGPFEQFLSFFLIYPFRCQLCTHRFLAFQGQQGRSRHREYDRIPVRFPVSFRSAYDGAAIKGEGTVLGLSIRGCALSCAQPLQTGAFLCLQLQASSGEAPIEVDVAVVRSAVQQRAGVEFLSVREPEEQRLRCLVETLLRGRPY